jgi:hypothetical protein
MAWVHRGETAGPGTSKEPQKKSLRLIISGVAQGDNFSIEVPASPLEKLVSRLTSGILDGSAVPPRPRPDVLAIDGKGQIERVRNRGRKLLITSRVVAELMIEVRGAYQTHIAARIELAQDEREGD